MPALQAMQYAITLPADYDMQIIRARVRSKGHLLDDFPGLGLKAYGIRERGVDGSPVNQYAPVKHNSAITCVNMQDGPFPGYFDGYFHSRPALDLHSGALPGAAPTSA